MHLKDTSEQIRNKIISGNVTCHEESKVIESAALLKVTPVKDTLPEPLSVLLRKHPFFEKKNASTFYFTDQNSILSDAAFKIFRVPQMAARLPVSGGRGPGPKRVRAQAVAGIPEQSLCQFSPEMPLSSPS